MLPHTHNHYAIYWYLLRTYQHISDGGHLRGTYDILKNPFDSSESFQSQQKKAGAKSSLLLQLKMMVLLLSLFGSCEHMALEHLKTFHLTLPLYDRRHFNAPHSGNCPGNRQLAGGKWANWLPWHKHFCLAKIIDWLLHLSVRLSCAWLTVLWLELVILASGQDTHYLSEASCVRPGKY